jgi:hypothetical protein
MQTVAEQQSQSTILAALFFSAPNRRDDPSKVITTLAYRIALQHQPYRHYVHSRASADPTIWDRSIVKQFELFIVEPFVKRQIYLGPSPILMFIDGLDECKGQREQINFLSLIAYFTTKYPNALLLWVIASRPEAHITTHLARRRLVPCFDKQEVAIDSPEACQDVERYLRAEFEKIRASDPYISLLQSWPSDEMFLTIAAAAGGLFAYATTVVCFIGDTSYGDSISKLQVVVELIRRTSPSNLGDSSPRAMAQLDALYQYILAQIAPEDMSRTKEILAYTIFNTTLTSNLPRRSGWHPRMDFMCDWIGMTPNIAYGALRHLHSVVQVPLPPEAKTTTVNIRHKSFSDFLLDPNRSEMSLGTKGDEELRDKLRAIKILRNIPSAGKSLSYSCQVHQFTFLHCVAQSTTPERPSHPHIVLSWLSESNAQELDSRRAELHILASILVGVCWKDVALHPDFCHALQVMQVSRARDDLVRCIFVCPHLSLSLLPSLMLFQDEAPGWAEQLKNDGSLWNIPARIIDLAVLQNGRLMLPDDVKRPTAYSEVVLTRANLQVLGISFWKSIREPGRAASRHVPKFFAFFEHARKQLTRDFFVTGFIGNNLKGWIKCCSTVPTECFPGPVTYYSTYDFSTIYDRLKAYSMREGFTTSP